MDQQKRLERWIEIARWAASGGNAQPWKIEWLVPSMSRSEACDTLAVCLTISSSYRKNPSPLDVGGAAAVFALGAFGFALRAAAALDGYALDETVFDHSGSYWTARVVLKFRAAEEVRALYTAREISMRRTDRNAFSCREISSGTRDRLRGVLDQYPNIQVSEFSNEAPKLKLEMAKGLRRIESVRWRDPTLLDGLLQEIAFEDDPSSNDKIPVSRLSLSKIDGQLLAWLQRSKSLRAVLRLGLSRIPSHKATRDLFSEESQVTLLALQSNPFETEIAAVFSFGSCFQHVWLEASRLGLSFQPVGLPLIAYGYWQHRMGRDSNIRFNHSQQQLAREVEDVTADFAKRLSIDLRSFVMGYRFGWPSREAGLSPRKTVEEILK